jgi:uncharacterized delta-60 repeat protein
MVVAGGNTALRRINADGTPDPTFEAANIVNVRGLALQTDGKILVCHNGTNFLLRLNPDGSPDNSFSVGGRGDLVGPFVVQADGKILVQGYFQTADGLFFEGLARLNSDGTWDTSFKPPVTAPSGLAVQVQADGKILVGGWVSMPDGQATDAIFRLNPDGTLDDSFPRKVYQRVTAIALQGDGRILAAGVKKTPEGVSIGFLDRLDNTAPATQALTLNGSAITWLRGGTSPEVWRTTFDYSTNGNDWINLGAGIRIAGGWQLSGVSVPGNANLRARGFTTGIGGERDSSATWFVESQIVFGALPPKILVEDKTFGFDGGQLRFTVSAAAGQQLVIEASTDLEQWTSIATNLVGTQPLEFCDAESATLPSRFYRVRVSK